MRTEYDVFISHKSEDKNLAEEVYEFLSHSVRVFYSGISLEKEGTAAFKTSIDNALDGANILIAVGTSVDNLTAEWVKYEWDSFHNDILSGRKTNGRIFTYLPNNVQINALPRTLRQNQVIEQQPDGLIRLQNFVSNALALQSISKLSKDGDKLLGQMHSLMEIMAESRLLELEITQSMFGLMLTQEQRKQMEKHISELRKLTTSPQNDVT